MAVLGWLELPPTDVPPELIWHHDERLAEWWEAVSESRKTGGSPDEHVPLTDNDLAKEYR